MQNKDAPARASAPARELDQSAPRTAKYRQAAVGYFVYGLIYLAGAIYLSTREAGPQGGWIWFAVGGAMAVLFPVLIWKQMKWVTRILSFLVAVRVLGLLRLIIDDGQRSIELPWGGELPILYGALAFLIVAAIECYLLARAGWDI